MRRRTPPPGSPDDEQAELQRGAARTNYAGAVYGSLLAASVVAGTGTPGGPLPRIQLVVLLLITGVVFWATHVYTGLVGDRLRHRPLSRREVRAVCVHESPIIKAAIPPAAAVAISPLLELGPSGTVWLGLIVAVAEQVGWATAAVVHAGASRRLILATGAVNLLLGLVIVAFKTALQH
ncbi:hypothetical protein GCM10020367_56370 [Streptomyces sannanensis]|uniref:Integral membrane protein n=1 Tax=Streptomyces sannanensis TaxID=285536 RepID=A0ABP6SIZ7_9ACTN